MSTTGSGAVRPSSVAEALEALRAAQKPPHGTPAYSRFINRPFGRQLAARLCVAGLTPNQVSGLSALCSFAAIILIATCAPALWRGLVAVSYTHLDV